MNTQTPNGALPADSPQLRVLGQYVKELSFRNPLGAAAGQTHDVQPMIDMGVQVKSRPVGDAGDAHEVELCITVQTKRGDEPMFGVDLTYAGLFQFVNMKPDEQEAHIWIECPRLLFPFSRQIVADVTRDGGYPPLLINPIDFTPLYLNELKAREEQGAVPLANAPGQNT